MTVSDVNGTVLRPNLLGALVGKAASREIMVDPARDRHLDDFATLASLLTGADLREPLSPLDARYLGNMVAIVRDKGLDPQVGGARRGINMLRSALRQRRDG